MTCPSRFYARYGKSGDPNPQYDGSRPRQKWRPPSSAGEASTV
ncbi:MAG: hypothetical protein AB2693_26510 [Candidatus Thiodiazotropha sp.]